MLPSLDNDARYDMGRIATAGNATLAKAQSDTILQASPTHLLGLVLGARAARLNKTAEAAAAIAVSSPPKPPNAANRCRIRASAADIDEALRTARQAP